MLQNVGQPFVRNPHGPVKAIADDFHDRTIRLPPRRRKLEISGVRRNLAGCRPELLHYDSSQVSTQIGVSDQAWLAAECARDGVKCE